jgi:GNAT superfamily N-acetyltransferase
MHNGSAPTAEMLVRQRKLNHLRVLAENRVHCATQVANAFAMNDSDARDAALLTLGEIIQHERLDVTRAKGVQIKHAINRHLDGFVSHPAKLPPGAEKGKIDSRERPSNIRRIEIRIRQATPADCATVAEFNLRLAEESEQLRLDADTVQKGVAAILGDTRKGIYFLAEADGTVAGQLMITYEWSDWRNGDLWWIQSVYVRPEFRRLGVFGGLFRHLEALARSRNDVAGLRLYMHADNSRARQTYERLGMKHTNYEVFDMDFVLKPKK